MIWYWLARALAAFLQATPLWAVALLGRAGGAVAYWVDGRHRRVALGNLTHAFAGELAPARIRALAREHFRRLGENYACAVKSAVSAEEIQEQVEIVGARKLLPRDDFEPVHSRIIALGHFGNFELFSFVQRELPVFRCATTYRPLPQPRLNEFVLSLRRRSGILLFDRRKEFRALRRELRSENLALGLFADQHAGSNGVRVPFFGRDCSTTTAPALLALRFRASLHTAVCFRTGLGRWRVEVGDEIPTRRDGVARPLAEIMSEVNQAFEIAVRRDPANWFWVHRRWKETRMRPALADNASVENSGTAFNAAAAPQTEPA